MRLRTRDPRAPWRPAPALAAAGAAIAVLVGCEFRDETVRTTVGTPLWPPASTPAAGDGDRPAAPGPVVDYDEGYESAARRAAAEGRPLLLVFRASWCRWSGELGRGRLNDPAVVARLRRCVCAVVDADRDAAICRTFGVTAFPTVIVIDPDGEERFRGTGAAGMDGLTAALDAAPHRATTADRLAGDASDVTR